MSIHEFWALFVTHPGKITWLRKAAVWLSAVINHFEPEERCREKVWNGLSRQLTSEATFHHLLSSNLFGANKL